MAEQDFSGKQLTKPGMVFRKEFRKTEVIVSMIEHGGTIFIATNSRVFKMVGDKLVQLDIIISARS